MTTICPPIPRAVGQIIHFEVVATGGAPSGVKYKIDIRKRKEGIDTTWSSVRAFFNLLPNQLIKYDYIIPITDKGGLNDICYYKVNVQYICPTDGLWKISSSTNCKFKIM